MSPGTIVGDRDVAAPPAPSCQQCASTKNEGKYSNYYKKNFYRTDGDQTWDGRG